MSVFKSPLDYRRFATQIRNNRRFLHTPEVSAFLEAVCQGSQNRLVTVPTGRTFCRAQLGHSEPRRGLGSDHVWVEAPHPPERMIPSKRNASEGRINPRGIAYLYLASDKKTAISEVRPSAEMFVTVAWFETTRKLTLVNLSRQRGEDAPTGLLSIAMAISENQGPLSPEQVDAMNWAQIDNAFSQPVDPSDQYLQYVPTQVLAESLVDQDYDGIIYKSGLSAEGHNVALFNVTSAQFVSARLFRITHVDYQFENHGNPWFLKNGKYFTTEITDVRPANDLRASDTVDECRQGD